MPTPKIEPLVSEEIIERMRESATTPEDHVRLAFAWGLSSGKLNDMYPDDFGFSSITPIPFTS